MTAQTTATIFDGATITLIQPFKAADLFDDCETDGVDIDASAEAYWEEYRAAVAEAYPTATVRIDTPWQQHSKPFHIDVDTADGDWSDQHEDAQAAIHAIGEMVFERGTFWVEAE